MTNWVSNQGPNQWTFRRLAAMLGLALFWTVEVYLVQMAAFDAPPVTHHPLLFGAARFFFDLATAVFLLLWLRRRWLVSLFIASFVLSLAVVAYGLYFHEPITVYVLNSLKEGVRVSSIGAQIIPTPVWAALIVGLVVKIVWACKIIPHPAPFRRLGMALCAAVSILLTVAIQFTNFRFGMMRASSGGLTYTYGYLVSWAAESWLAPTMKELGRELVAAQKDSPDRLNGVEPAWPVSGHVVVMQLESIGWSVLNCRMQGQEVAPYLDQLAQSDRVLRIHAFHSCGSEDMDYAVLSDGTPSSRVFSFAIPNVEYPNALPRFMQTRGYHTVSFHGNDGGFYNRRQNYQRMGFDEILFKRELAQQPVRLSSWGVRDREVLKISSQKLRQAKSPQFHFIITLDSHVPFNLIDDSEKQIFPHSADWRENYFNSVRVLDQDLRNYIESLPAGTLVIMYGDHTSGVEYGDFHAAREGEAEYVPCIVHVCGGAANWPPTLSPEAKQVETCDLHILDVENHLRRYVESQVASTRAEPAGALVRIARAAIQTSGSH